LGRNSWKQELRCSKRGRRRGDGDEEEKPRKDQRETKKDTQKGKERKGKEKEGESDRVLQRSLRAAKVTVTVNAGARDGGSRVF
jgi:hypothetical protein